MPKFSYITKDREARLLTGTIDAPDKSFIIKELKKRNLVIISITEEKEKVKPFVVGKRRINSMELVIFSRQLATLIDAGISLIPSLNVLHDQIENPYLKKTISNIKGDIEGGNSLHASFAKYPNIFPSIFVNMVRAGETSGSLDKILERMAEYLERIENLRRKIKAALAYPIIVVGMAIAIVTFLMLKVVPAFKNIFETLKGDLPLPTKVLIAASNLSIKFFLPSIGVLIIIIILFIRYINTRKGRLKFDNFKLKLPIFGPIIKKMAISKFSQTLATLVKSGIGILEAFEIAGKVSGNKVIEMAVEQIRINLRAGETISGPMEETGKFPPFVVKMIAVGEQTAELEKMLSKISEYYEDQVNESLSGLTSMIEPIIICFLGVSIGFIVVSMFLPIFKLTQLIGGR